ncbi:MAG: hypothetical protein VW443_02885 [Pseudomonadales bacterium]
MPISSETTRTGPYTGNGGTTVFAYTFLVFDDDDLEVVLTTTATGAEVIQTKTTHYTVSGVGSASGGNVTMVTPPTSGQTLTIRRKLDLLQDDDFTNQDQYRGGTHERIYDELTQMMQQLQEQIDRCIKLPVSTATSVSAECPAPAADKSWEWNATADALEEVDGPSGSVAAAAASATAAASSATAAAASASILDTVAFPYGFDTGTSMADPGTGEMRFNHATPSSVTAVAFSNVTNSTGNPDISDYIMTMDDSSSTLNGHMIFVKQGAPANFAIYTVGACTDNNAWLQVNLTHVDSSGTFDGGDTIRVQFVRTGDKGETGAQGIQGPQGPVSVGLLMALA